MLHLQQKTKMGRGVGYNEDALYQVIKEIMPKGFNDWENVVAAYKKRAEEQEERKLDHLKGHWMKMCNFGKKPTGQAARNPPQQKYFILFNALLDASRVGNDGDSDDEEEEEEDDDDLQNEVFIQSAIEHGVSTGRTPSMAFTTVRSLQAPSPVQMMSSSASVSTASSLLPQVGQKRTLDGASAIKTKNTKPSGSDHRRGLASSLQGFVEHLRNKPDPMVLMMMQQEEARREREEAREQRLAQERRDYQRFEMMFAMLASNMAPRSSSSSSSSSSFSSSSSTRWDMPPFDNDGADNDV